MTLSLRMALPALLAAAAVGLALAAGPLPARAAGDSDGHGSEGVAAGPVYVKLETITVTIFRDDQPAGLYSTALTLELARPDQRTLVEGARIRLRDAMLRRLHALIEREGRTGKEVGVEDLKHAMRAVARRELGSDVVVDLFVHAIMRKGA